MDNVLRKWKLPVSATIQPDLTVELQKEKAGERKKKEEESRKTEEEKEKERVEREGLTEGERYKRRPAPTLIKEDVTWCNQDSIKVVVGCQPLVGILNGGTGTKCKEVHKVAEEITDMVTEIIKRGVNFHKSIAPPFEWRRREFNKQADYVANTAMDTQKSNTARWMPQGGAESERLEHNRMERRRKEEGDSCIRLDGDGALLRLGL